MDLIRSTSHAQLRMYKRCAYAKDRPSVCAFNKKNPADNEEENNPAILLFFLFCFVVVEIAEVRWALKETHPSGAGR